MKFLYLALVLPLVLALGCAHAGDHLPTATEIAKALNDHNRAIDTLLSAPEQITIMIRCKWYENNTDHMKEFRIESTNDARRILRDLKTEDRHPDIRAHGCPGHIKICFVFNGQDQVISFDHGQGIMSSLMSRIAFRELPKEQCQDLIAFLEEQGFTKRQMGMNE